MTEGETVLQVIGEMTADNPDMRMLYSSLLDSTDVKPSDLSYEDWVTPMKLTGGRVCIKETMDHPQTIGPWYYTYRRDGLLVMRSDGKTAEGPEAVRWFKAGMDGDTDMTPVLREETPFGDSDG